MSNLRSRAMANLIRIAIVRGGCVFLFAWTFHFWQAWVFVAVSLAAEVATALYLLRNDPALLERRLGEGVKARAEGRGSQQAIQHIAQLLMLVTMALAATDHREGWSSMPAPVAVVGDLLMTVGLLVVFLVFKANTYAAATVQVEENQRVISSGPYALVRHPMYGGLVIVLIGTPIGLGSWWALLPGVLLTAVLAVRLLDEEKFLANNLAGYSEYMSTVRHRLVPLVW